MAPASRISPSVLPLVRSSLPSTTTTPYPSLSTSNLILKRKVHDLQIPPNSNRPLIKSGPGGRSSVTGKVATVFGCSGFLGRYLVSKLARQGTQVIVPVRDWDEARHLKVSGDLGVVVPMEIDIRNDSQIEECIRHSDIVYNLIGRDHETKNFDFSSIHVEAPRRLARLSTLCGVPRFVHVSHLNASPNSKSQVYRAKYEGEAAVTDSFDGATIVRPGPMYGKEDTFINTMVHWPWSWRANEGRTRTRPVYVNDIAQALHLIAEAPLTSTGSLFTLPGPRIFNTGQLLHYISLHTLPSKSLAEGSSPPKWLWILAARIWEQVLWFGGRKLSADVIKRRYLDDVGTRFDSEDFIKSLSGGVGKGYESMDDMYLHEIASGKGNVDAYGYSLLNEVGEEKWWKVGEPPAGVSGQQMEWKTWKDLQMTPSELEDWMIWLVRSYRSDTSFADPIAKGGIKFRRPVYRTLE